MKQVDETTLSHRRIPVVRIVVLVALAAFSAFVSYRLLLGRPVDPDTFWHIKTGEWIVQHGAIPTTDPFSWYGIEHQLRWLPQEALFGVFAYAFWLMGGFHLVYAVSSILIAAAVLTVCALTYVRSRAWPTSLIAGVLALLAMLPSVAPRPQIATFVLLPLVAICLEKKRWCLALLLMILGVNLHGAFFPIYLVLFAFYTLPRQWRVMAAAVLATMLTPLGWHLLLWPLWAFNPWVTYIMEFAPTTLSSDPLLFAAFVALVFLIDRGRVPWRDALLALALALLALRAIRNVPLFFLLAVPLLAPYLRSISRDSPTEGPREDRAPSTRQTAGSKARILDVGLATALALGAAATAVLIWTTPFDLNKGYPRAALDYLRSAHIERIWNEWADGGYLIFNDYPPLIDGRADPFMPMFNKGENLGPDYLTSSAVRADLRPLLDQNRIKYVLISSSGRLYRVLEQSKDFEPVYSDSSYVLFEYHPGGA